MNALLAESKRWFMCLPPFGPCPVRIPADLKPRGRKCTNVIFRQRSVDEPVDPVADGVLADRLERGDGVAVLEEAAEAPDVVDFICREEKANDGLNLDPDNLSLT